VLWYAFSALTLLFRHQEEHLACKNWVMRYGCGYLSGMRFKVQTICIWCRLTQAVLEKRPLNRCLPYRKTYTMILKLCQMQTLIYHTYWNHFPAYFMDTQWCNLLSQVECLLYNKLHMILWFINFSRYTISFDRAYNTRLIILTENNRRIAAQLLLNL